MPETFPLSEAWAGHALTADRATNRLEILAPDGKAQGVPTASYADLALWAMERGMRPEDLATTWRALAGLRGEPPEQALGEAQTAVAQAGLSLSPDAGQASEGPILHLNGHYAVQQIAGTHACLIHDLTRFNQRPDDFHPDQGGQDLARLAEAAKTGASVRVFHDFGYPVAVGTGLATNAAWNQARTDVAGIAFDMLSHTETVQRILQPHAQNPAGLAALTAVSEKAGADMVAVLDPERYREQHQRPGTAQQDPVRQAFRQLDAFIVNATAPGLSKDERATLTTSKTALRALEKDYAALQQRALGHDQSQSQTQRLGR